MAHAIHPSRRVVWLLFSCGFIANVSLCLALPASSHEVLPTLTRRAWGGFDQRAHTEQCYRQNQTATLLALLLGPFAADQFYAHHWLLAAMKLTFSLLCAQWSFRDPEAVLFGLVGVWVLVDVILWIVGGVYGTPACGGSIWH